MLGIDSEKFNGVGKYRAISYTHLKVHKRYRMSVKKHGRSYRTVFLGQRKEISWSKLCRYN